MTFRSVVPRVALSVLALGCTGADRESDRWHDDPPALVVEGRMGAESLAAVVRVPAPAIRYAALVQPDPNRAVPAIALGDGELAPIVPEAHVRKGQTLAVLRPGAAGGHATIHVPAPADGVWRPRRSEGQFVMRGDTLGAVWARGAWLAVGSVGELEYGVIHPGDPATVFVRDDREHSGRVETVSPPGVVYPYSAQIAVEFAGPEGPWSAATHEVSVVVMPAGPRDSLLAVPASAIVRLQRGDAVFVARGGGRYGVSWILAGPRAGSLVTVRGTLPAGSMVVTGGIGALSRVARDSMQARARGGERR